MLQVITWALLNVTGSRTVSSYVCGPGPICSMRWCILPLIWGFVNSRFLAGTGSKEVGWMAAWNASIISNPFVPVSRQRCCCCSAISRLPLCHGYSQSQRKAKQSQSWSNSSINSISESETETLDEVDSGPWSHAALFIYRNSNRNRNKNNGNCGCNCSNCTNLSHPVPVVRGEMRGGGRRAEGLSQRMLVESNSNCSPLCVAVSLSCH